jgi:hypothetical protein
MDKVDRGSELLFTIWLQEGSLCLLRTIKELFVMLARTYPGNSYNF